MIRRVLILVFIVFAGMFTWYAYQYYIHRGLVKLNIVVAPKDSLLSIDGEAVRPGTIYVKPGAHTLVASRELFESDIKQVNTSDLQPGDKIYMLPRAVAREAREWLQKNPYIQKEMESAGGAEAERNRKVLLKKYPFLEELPKETVKYRVDYSVNDSYQLNLKVTLFAIINRPQDYPEYKKQLVEYKEEALKYLESLGVGRGSFPIEYSPSLEE